MTIELAGEGGNGISWARLNGRACPTMKIPADGGKGTSLTVGSGGVSRTTETGNGDAEIHGGWDFGDATGDRLSALFSLVVSGLMDIE